MDRKALIMSNPGEVGDEKYCKGVYIDVDNYKRHLISPLGGSWYNHEILVHDRPTKKQVDDYVNQLSNYDYTIIIFTGHGYYSKYKDTTIIELRKDEEYDSLDLRRATNKRTIILDCCRKIYLRVIFEDSLAKAAVRAAKTLNPNRCRIAFEKEITQCANGVVVGYGCAKNEMSGENESTGGYYSSGLLRGAKKWLENDNTDIPKYHNTLSIVSAHNKAIEFVDRASSGNQHPEIEKPRSGSYFPFAVIA